MKNRFKVLLASILSSSCILLGLFYFLGLAFSGLGTPAFAASPSKHYADKQQTIVPVTSTHKVCVQGPPECDYSEIQLAVDQSIDGDLIKIAGGVYTGVHARPAPSGYPFPPQGGFITQVVMISKAITLQGGYTLTDWSIPDPTLYPTIIDAQGQGRVLVISGISGTTVSGLNITGGDSDRLGGGTIIATHDAGGGIYILSAAATLRDSWLRSNRGGEGGGIYLQRSEGTIEGNQVFGNDAVFVGGGVGLDQSSMNFTSNSMYSNTSELGGGIYAVNSIAALSGNEVISQTGSGVYVDSNTTITITGNTFLSNTFFPTSMGHGGALYLCGATGTVISNTFRANRAATGGAIALNCGSSARITGNTFTQNYASNEGGAVYISGISTTVEANIIHQNQADTFAGGLSWFVPQAGDVLLDNEITDNTASYGGGVVIWGGTGSLSGNQIISNSASQLAGGILIASHSVANLTNNIVADNYAETSASGVYIGGSTVEILHNTVARNQGGDGTGVYVVHEPSHASFVQIVNTILVSHTVGITVLAGNAADLQATLWGGGRWANLDDWGGSGSITTGTINIHENPYFLAPAAMDYHIRLQSPAVDAGLDAGVFTDIDDQPRPYSLAPDIGADEVISFSLPEVITIDGSTLGLAGEIYTFTASVSPVSTTLPITYHWQAAGLSPVTHTTGLTDTASYRWETAGSQALTVTASNFFGTVTGTHTITITDVPINDLVATNDSPTLLGVVTTLSATISAGTNVSYTWDFGDESLGSGAVITHTYPGVDVYTATVTASNTVNTLTATTVVMITSSQEYISPEVITIDGPTLGLTGEIYTFTASVSPVSTTLPITYHWQAAGLSPVTHTTGLADTASYRWETLGSQVLTVTASNFFGTVTGTHIITVTDVPIGGLVAMNDSPTLLGTATTLSATINAGTNVSFTWDFGDESFGTGAVVTHTYPSVGIYTATINAMNSANTLTATTIITITKPLEYLYLPLILKGQNGEGMSRTSAPTSASLATMPFIVLSSAFMLLGTIAGIRDWKRLKE